MKKIIIFALSLFFISASLLVAESFSGDFSYSKTFTTSNDSKEYQLLYASTMGDLETVKSLLRSKTNPNKLPTQSECEYYAKEVIGHDDFEDEQEYKEYYTTWKTTPLIAAVANNNFDCVKALVGAAADITAENPQGDTALIRASIVGYYDIAEYLLSRGAPVNYVTKIDKQTALLEAIYNHQTKIVELLLKNKADTSIGDKDGYSPVNYAAQNNYVDILKILIANKADVNKASNNKVSPLLNASFNGNLESVKELVAAGADINYKGIFSLTPTLAAARQENIEIFKFLLQQNPDLSGSDDQNCSLLSYAVLSNQAEIAEYLLKKGADVNHKEKDGFTPLMIAASFGYADCVDILLKYKADVNLVNNSGYDAHFIAVNNGFDGVADLIKNGR